MKHVPIANGRADMAGIAAPGRRAVRAARRVGSTGTAFAHFGFGYLAALLDALTICAVAVIAPAIYQTATLGLMPHVESVTSAGVVVAALVVLSTLQRGGYDHRLFLDATGQAARAAAVWNFAFGAAIVLSVLTKTTSDFSRGAIGVFYVVGIVSLTLARRALVDLFAAMQRAGLAPPRRLFIVGFEDGVAELLAQKGPPDGGAEIVSAIALRDRPSCLAEDLALATAAVRVKRPDDVYIAVPWSRADVVAACVDAFLPTPAEIHMASGGILERYSEARIARLGPLVGLKVTSPALTRLEQLEKRLLDIALGTLALVALAPFLLLTALLIRIDSPGPVLFRQKRYGFNQEPFRIYKFRTMSVAEDGAHVAQATKNDPRVTRIGAFLRRFSIDELPQLLNVLRGEMSLVGPRPHALAHDQRYVRSLALYARRHNVKPGITGWAQVRGYRGEISSDEKMQGRLEHDLYYVDNWSFWFDLKIILLTVISPRAHSNAY